MHPGAGDAEGPGSPRSTVGFEATAGATYRIAGVKAWELKPNARYALWFIWPDAVAFGVECRFAKA